MVTAKQRAWRKTFARRYGGKKKRRRSSTRRAPSIRRSYRRKVSTMARYRRRGRSRRRGIGGLGSWKNMVKLAGGGILAGALIAKFAPQVPYAGPIGGFVVGGLPGAIAAFAAPVIMNAVGGNGGAQASWQ